MSDSEGNSVPEDSVCKNDYSCQSGLEFIVVFFTRKIVVFVIRLHF